MKNNKWTLFYFIGILIGIIILMLSYTPRINTIELFDNTNNSILGGAIVTLQLDFTKLLTEFDILEKNMENTYSMQNLSGNTIAATTTTSKTPTTTTSKTPTTTPTTTPTVTKLYSNIQNIKAGMNGFLETDILQPAPTKDSNSTPTVSSKQTISNKTIKSDPRWEAEFKPLLNELKTNFTTLSTNIKEYLANIPYPLPANITKDQTSIITILTNMQLTIKTINEYIIDILK